MLIYFHGKQILYSSKFSRSKNFRDSACTALLTDKNFIAAPIDMPIGLNIYFRDSFTPHENHEIY